MAATPPSRRLVPERADRNHAGGNSLYTAGATRITHNGLADLRDLVEPDERHDLTEVPPYSESEYLQDLAAVTDGRNDPQLSAVLTAEATDGLRWLKAKHGMRYRLMYERQAYRRVDGT